MSTPPPIEPPDDADERYRRASELDPSRPSEATRRAVLEHAARLAAERARRGTRRRWPLAGVTLRWQAIVGTAAAAALAGVMIAPQFLSPNAPSGSQQAPAAAPAASEARQEPAPAPAPAPVESAPPAIQSVNSPERARIPPSARRAPLRGTAPVEAAPAAPAASDAVTTLQLEQRAEANAARAPSLAQQVAVDTAARGVAGPSASASRSAPVVRAPSAQPQASASPDALRHAAAAGDLTALKGALAGGSDIDARDAEGRTALMLATLNGRADAVAELLAHGADPSGADAHGTTPLQAAVAADEREIIAMLRRYGAR
jgi:ankyrin repeat protein